MADTSQDAISLGQQGTLTRVQLLLTRAGLWWLHQGTVLGEGLAALTRSGPAVQAAGHSWCQALQKSTCLSPQEFAPRQLKPASNHYKAEMALLGPRGRGSEPCPAL